MRYGGLRMKNEEIVLQNKLIVCHRYIEEQLNLIERETLIGRTRKRCDILFEDKNGKPLFVEVKEYVDDKAIDQIIQYKEIVSSKDARFMLISNRQIEQRFINQLKDSEIESRWINKYDIDVKIDSILEVPKGGSKYKTRDKIFQKLNKQSGIAREIFNFVSTSLHTTDNPIMCNISDGIMFQIINRNEKFLSLSTKGNRLLFHLPKVSKQRDNIFNKYKTKIPELYRYKDIYPDKKDREHNQIDIKLKNVRDLDYIKPLIIEIFTCSINHKYRTS